MDLTHCRLLVKRYQECFLFYRDVLGLPLVWGDAGSGYAEFSAGGVRLALFDAEEMADVVGTSEMVWAEGAKDRIAIVFRVPNVDVISLALSAKDIQLLTSPEDRPHWGVRTVHFRDPDGNLIEVNQKLD